jgi:hypothetical protein
MGRTLILRMLMTTLLQEGIREMVLRGRMVSIAEGGLLPLPFLFHLPDHAFERTSPGDR